MEGVQTVDVSWLHHSQKGQSPVLLGVRFAAWGAPLEAAPSASHETLSNN